MNSKEEMRLLIDRYLANSLSGMELQKFIERLSEDELFRKEVLFQNLIVDAIRQAHDNQLQSAILSEIKYKKAKVPFGLRLIILFLAITISGIMLWDFIGSGPVNNSKKPLFSFNIFKRKPIEHHKEEFTPVKVKKPVIIKTETAEDSIHEDETDNITDDHGQSSDTVSAAETDQELVIRKDQFLLSYSMKAMLLEPHAKEEKSIAQSTAEKLNPVAGLPDDNPNPDVYKVEFWISPVNYRGYKLINDKLVLFGVEEPDAVRLFVVNKNLIMKYGKEFYKLHPTHDFVSFTITKEVNLSNESK